MIRYRHVRHPHDPEDARYMVILAGRMMQHFTRAPWWDVRLKLRCLVGACAYARRSLEGPWR